MSKGGGAGKVYFVLYLAVVLELLIIIVERDEAEEGLQKKQKETMKIVESILSQLQSGAGTEGINTRPQDEITLFDKGSVEALGPNGKNIKSNRTYTVEVGVTDVSTDLLRKENEPEKEYFERLVKYSKLANVEEIEYQIFYSGESEEKPMFYSDDSLKKNGINMANLKPGDAVRGPNNASWSFLSSRKLLLDLNKTNQKINPSGKSVGIEELEPIYQPPVVNSDQRYAPAEIPDSAVFFYSSVKTREKLFSMGGRSLLKRSFEVNFQPNDKPGWYKLRFASRTNRILGVKADARVDEMNEETTVNIGTVQLTVKDLNKVKKELQSKLEKYNLPSFDLLAAKGDGDKFDEQLDIALKNAAADHDGGDDAKSKVKLFGYIAKLLAPGQSINFSQNKGSIEFDIKVNKLQPQTISPKILLDDEVNMVFFDVVKPYFKFSIIPYKDASSIAGIDLQLKTDDGRTVIINKADITPLGTSAANTAGPNQGQKADFIAKVNDVIEGGIGQPRYVTISAKYAANGKTDTASAKMLIYKTGMQEENDLREQLKNESFIGNYIDQGMMLNPNSAGKIRNDRFQLLFSVNDGQSSPVDGIKIPFNGFYFPDGSSKASLKVLWKKPLNNEPVVIFSTDMPVTLAKPKLAGTPRADFRGPENDMVVKIGEIVVTRPPSGKTNEYLETSVSGSVSVAGAPLKTRGNPIFTPVGNITPDMKVVKYNITIRLSGELDPEKTEFRGKINLNVTAVGTSKSGDKTPSATKPYSIDFRYRPETGE
jgi:hypothetical protein